MLEWREFFGECARAGIELAPFDRQFLPYCGTFWHHLYGQENIRAENKTILVWICDLCTRRQQLCRRARLGNTTRTGTCSPPGEYRDIHVPESLGRAEVRNGDSTRVCLFFRRGQRVDSCCADRSGRYRRYPGDRTVASQIIGGATPDNTAKRCDSVLLIRG